MNRNEVSGNQIVTAEMGEIPAARELADEAEAAFKQIMRPIVVTLNSVDPNEARLVMCDARERLYERAMISKSFKRPELELGVSRDDAMIAVLTQAIIMPDDELSRCMHELSTSETTHASSIAVIQQTVQYPGKDDNLEDELDEHRSWFLSIHGPQEESTVSPEKQKQLCELTKEIFKQTTSNCRLAHEPQASVLKHNSLRGILLYGGCSDSGRPVVAGLKQIFSSDQDTHQAPNQGQNLGQNEGHNAIIDLLKNLDTEICEPVPSVAPSEVDPESRCNSVCTDWEEDGAPAPIPAAAPVPAVVAQPVTLVHMQQCKTPETPTKGKGKKTRQDECETSEDKGKGKATLADEGDLEDEECETPKGKKDKKKKRRKSDDSPMPQEKPSKKQRKKTQDASGSGSGSKKKTCTLRGYIEHARHTDDRALALFEEQCRRLYGAGDKEKPE